MGLHATSLTIGGALAGPLAGGLLDAHGPAWTFAISGVIGVAPVLLAGLVWRKAPVGGAAAATGSGVMAGASSEAGAGVVAGPGSGGGANAATPLPSPAGE